MALENQCSTLQRGLYVLVTQAKEKMGLGMRNSAKSGADLLWVLGVLFRDLKRANIWVYRLLFLSWSFQHSTFEFMICNFCDVSIL